MILLFQHYCWSFLWCYYYCYYYFGVEYWIGLRSVVKFLEADTIFHLYQNQLFYILPTIFLPTQSYLLLYSLCANIRHSHSVSLPRPLYHTICTLLLAWVLSIFAVIAFVLMAWSCAAIVSDSISLFILSSLSHSCYEQSFLTC